MFVINRKCEHTRRDAIYGVSTIGCNRGLKPSVINSCYSDCLYANINNNARSKVSIP